VLMPRLLKTSSFRQTALYGAVMLMSFGLLLFLTYWTITAALRDQIKVQIAGDIEALGVEASADGTASILEELNERINASSASPNYIYLADAKGAKLAGNIESIDMIEGWRELGPELMAVKPAATVDGEDHRLWGLGKRLTDGAYLFIGQDAATVLATQETIVTSFAWSAGIASLLAALAGLAISQGFLRRIDAINITSQAIMDGKLKHRIPVRGTSDEIDRVSANLNRLFDSNQELLERLKQQGTSIAHDLRTPLSRLRQGLEDARDYKGRPAAYAQAIDSAIVECDQILSSFAALLRIGQIEAGTRRAGFKRLDLRQILETVHAAYAAVAEDQGKTLEKDLAMSPAIEGDRDLLTQMFANAVENAIHHTPAGTRIFLTLLQSGAKAVVSVADNGPGIPEAERERVFERFFRLDESRHTPGNGLGLPLVSAVADIHGARVSLHDNRPGLLLQLEFPTA
jgi:signal transduction histidine kinase